MSTSDNHVLIRTDAPDGKPVVVRTYLSNQRAQEDLDLLNSLCDGTFVVIVVQHIDD